MLALNTPQLSNVLFCRPQISLHPTMHCVSIAKKHMTLLPVSVPILPHHTTHTLLKCKMPGLFPGPYRIMDASNAIHHVLDA